VWLNWWCGMSILTNYVTKLMMWHVHFVNRVNECNDMACSLWLNMIILWNNYNLDYIQIKYSINLIFLSKVKPCNRFNLESLNILRCDFEGWSPWSYTFQNEIDDQTIWDTFFQGTTWSHKFFNLLNLPPNT
jgi:hypothetical protein